jgi:hypothetical protein
LKNLKIVSEYIVNSENYKNIKEIADSGIKLSKDEYFLLNKRAFEQLNEHLINKVKIVNRLKAVNIQPYNNVEFELYLTPDTSKVRLYTKLIEIRKMITNIENKIGNWDIVSYFFKILEKQETINRRSCEHNKKQPSAI